MAGIEPASFTNTAKASTCVVSHECPKQRHRDLRCLVSCEKLRQTHATSFAIPAKQRFIPSGHRYKTQNCTIRQFVLIFLRSQQRGTQALAPPVQFAATEANNIAVFTYFFDGLITKPTVISDTQPSCYLQNRTRNTPTLKEHFPSGYEKMLCRQAKIENTCVFGAQPPLFEYKTEQNIHTYSL